MKNFHPTIGLDKMILSATSDVDFDVNYLLRYSYNATKNISITDELASSKSALLCQTSSGKDVTKIKIIDNTLFSDLSIYAVHTGYNRRKVCAKLTLSVTLYRGDSNLIPLNYLEYDFYIRKVLDYLAKEYHIFLSYECLRVHYMEINATIPMADVFYKYDRCFRLLFSLMPKTLSKLKIHRHKKKDIVDSYSRECQSYSVILYNKLRQLEAINKSICDISAPAIARLEYRLNADKLKNIIIGSNQQTRYWRDMQQQTIYSFLDIEYKKLRNTYLRWRNTKEKEIIKDLKKVSSEYPNDYHQRIIQRCLNAESLQDIPYILDLQQIFDAFPKIEKAAFQKNRSRTKRSFIRSCIDNNVFLDNHSEKMEELFQTIKLAIDNFSMM